MPTVALVLALCSAGVHALWNILLARARDSEAATAVAIVAGAIVFAPVAALTWEVEPAALPTSRARRPSRSFISPSWPPPTSAAS